MYDYQTEKAKVFTEEGSVVFAKMRDKARKLLEVAGAVRMDYLMQGILADPWLCLACADRMLELGDFQEVKQAQPPVGQHRIFVTRS
jgi:hypothetical protein